MIQTLTKILKSIIFDGKLYIPRKVISVTAYIIVPLVLLFIYLFSTQAAEIRGNMGEIALILLLVILFVKPLSVIFKPVGLLRTVVGYRRQLGVAASYFVFFHFWTYAALLNQSPHITLINELQVVGPLWYGAAAYLIIIVLYLTSNRFATRVLKKWWKRLHRIAYLLVPLVLIHAALVQGNGLAQPIVVSVLFFALKLIEWNWSKMQKTAAPSSTE